MATLTSLTINDTGYLELPRGTTAQRPGSPAAGYMRFNTTVGAPEVYNGSAWVGELGQSPQYAAVSASQILTNYSASATGFYWINPGGHGPIKLWCDMTYSSGGWALVMCNRAGTGSMPNVTYSAAVNSVNVRRAYTSDLDFNLFVGTRYWVALGLNIAQFCSTGPTLLSNTTQHTKRYRWSYTGFSATYGFQGAAAVSDETSTGAPGFYSYHAAGGYSLTTYDNDQDVHPGNCSTFYGNHPFWFGACWSGNMWGSTIGGYAEAPFWDGSGGDYHNYMAVYLKV